jgi:hypothetical protein
MLQDKIINRSSKQKRGVTSLNKIYALQQLVAVAEAHKTSINFSHYLKSHTLSILILYIKFTNPTKGSKPKFIIQAFPGRNHSSGAMR